MGLSHVDADSFLNHAFLTERSQNRWSGLVLFFGGFAFLALGVIWLPMGAVGLALLVIGPFMLITGKQGARRQ